MSTKSVPSALREELGCPAWGPVQQRQAQGEAREGRTPGDTVATWGGREVGQVQLSVPAIRQQPGPAWSERTQTRRGDGQVSFLFHIKPTAGDCWPKDHQQSRLTDATTPPLRAWAGRGGAHSLLALLPGARCRGENQCQPREQQRPCAHRPGLLGGCVAVGKSGVTGPSPGSNLHATSGLGGPA